MMYADACRRRRLSDVHTGARSQHHDASSRQLSEDLQECNLHGSLLTTVMFSRPSLIVPKEAEQVPKGRAIANVYRAA